MMDLFGKIQPVHSISGVIQIAPTEKGSTANAACIVDAMMLADGGVYGQVVNATFEDLEVS